MQTVAVSTGNSNAQMRTTGRRTKMKSLLADILNDHKINRINTNTAIDRIPRTIASIPDEEPPSIILKIETSSQEAQEAR